MFYRLRNIHVYPLCDDHDDHGSASVKQDSCQTPQFSIYLPQLKLFFHLCSFRKIGGPEPDETSGFKGGFKQVSYRLGGVENITVEVNNKLVNKEIHNVFGVIKGFDDPGKTKLLFGVT